MNECSSPLTLERAIVRWRRLAITSAIVTSCCGALLAVMAFLAVQTLDTQYNLYYLLWKAGVRPYERSVAWRGLKHDFKHRQQLIGMTVEQFERTFPGTFHKVMKVPPIAKPNQEYYIDNFQQAQNKDGGFFLCWLAVFEDGRLIECEVAKG